MEQANFLALQSQPSMSHQDIPHSNAQIHQDIQRKSGQEFSYKFSAPGTPTSRTSMDKVNIESGASQNISFKTQGSLEEAEEDEDEDDEDVYSEKTPLMTCATLPQGGDSEEEDDIYKIEKVRKLIQSAQRTKLKFWVVIEWMALACIMSILICSFTITKLKHFKIWDLELWKWCVLLSVIVCGRLLTELVMHGLVFLIEMNFMLRKKLLYYVYELKRSVQVCIWLGFVLLSWTLLFRGRSMVLKKVTRAIASLLVGAVIWLIKNAMIKTLAASVNVNSYFDRIRESFYHQYVLQMLSGPSLMDLPESIGHVKTPGQLSVRIVTEGNGGEGKEMINVAKLHKLKQGRVSAWTMKLLSIVISTTSLSTTSDSYENGEQKDIDINCEWEAKAAAFRIFKNVAKPGHKSIYKDDLLRFLKEEEVGRVFSLFEGAVEAGRIKKVMLKKWAVKVYLERKSLAHALNDAQTAVKQLNKVASAIVLLMIVIVWMVLLGFATTQMMLFVSSQMILVVFVFGNTAKVVFEGIIFVFVMHPFDVGDRCVIDGIQVLVEEMNILSTVFLRYDNQKLYYPNAELAKKCIGNLYRSPFIGDSVEFTIDVSTPAESIVALKARIKMYIINKPQHWNPEHSVVMLEIENMDKMKMAVCVCHTVNSQDMGETIDRRSDLVFELKKILEELGIKYRLLPQEVIITHAGSATIPPPPPVVSTTTV